MHIGYSPNPSLFAVLETEGCCTINEGEAQGGLLNMQMLCLVTAGWLPNHMDIRRLY